MLLAVMFFSNGNVKHIRVGQLLIGHPWDQGMSNLNLSMSSLQLGETHVGEFL